MALNPTLSIKAKIDKYSTSPLTDENASGDGKNSDAPYGVGAGDSDSVDDEVEDDSEVDSAGEGVAEGDAEASEVELEVDSVLLVVEDFFDGEDVASALLVAPVFFVIVLEVPDALVPVFFVEEVLAPDVVEDFFFEAVVLLALVLVVLGSLLFAHAVTNASAARIVIKEMTDFFIVVRARSLS